MEAIRSRQPERPAYQEVPLDDEMPEVWSGQQHLQSGAAPSSEPGAFRPFRYGSNSHEREPLQSPAAGLPERQLEHGHESERDPERETKGTGSSPSLGSNSDSSNSIKRNEAWWDRKRTADRLWLYELLGALGSLACFAALVAVLRRSEGKEQSRWLYNKLTLNGLIALLSTFIRASMMFSVGACLSQMKWNHFSSQSSQGSSGRRLEDLNTFDEASRGPFGSLKLLFAWTRPHLGLIGALITIFTLAFDAFAQEVVILQFQNVSGVNGTTVGQVARSETYDRWTKVTQETSKTREWTLSLATSNARIDWVTDLNTVAAEYNGIFNYQNITAPAAQCSTGNCTWPVVPSLAVCGSCTDVTPAMDYSCVGVPGSNQNCTYTLTVGSSWSLGPPGYSFSTSPTGSSANGDPVLAYIVVSDYRTPYYNNSKYAYLDTWLMINASLTAVTANVCGLWFCVQAYETTISNGVLSQKIIGNWSETDITLDQSSGHINFTNIPPDIQQATPYSVDAGVLVAFGQNPIFGNDNVTYGSDSLTFYAYTSTTVRSLLSIADYASWIDLFALGMANNVRSTGTSSTPPSTYAGTVLASLPFVHVRWAWLAFPAAMVAASLLFLAACIWQTQYLRIEPWKGDALALLLASVDEDVERDAVNRWRVERRRVWLKPSGGTAVFTRPVEEKML
ncbi:hypothetical protein LTR59_000536 [Friedmanniomyces endolithicus]|nr:hypothetical protein LTR59_000536 [Friedmanniomyces endolithicus]